MAYYTDPNQTKFSLEEPLFEQMGQIPEPENPEVKETTPLLKQKKFVIMLIVGVTLVVLGVLYLINSYISQQKLVKDQELPEEVQEPQDPDHPLYQRIKSGQQELKDADPSQQDLVYPTLDYGIRLDPDKR